MPKEKKRTGKYCVAAGCTSTNADNISVHEFPKEIKRELRRKWINFVKTKRQDFNQPSRFLVLCELHFAPDCYPAEYRIKHSMGIEIKKKRLLPDAVPTIHLPITGTSTSSSHNTPIHNASQIHVTHMPNIGVPASASTLCLRLLDYNNAQNIETKNVETQEDAENAACSVGVQCTGRKHHQRSKIIQTKIRHCEKAVLCDIPTYKPRVCSIAVQCNRYLEELRDNFKPCKVMGMSTDEQEDISIPSSEDENAKLNHLRVTNTCGYANRTNRNNLLSFVCTTWTLIDSN